MTENYADVNNIKICYEIHGEGYPLILVHGFGSKKETWNAQIPPLSDHFKVIAVDNRGAGKSDRPDEPYTMKLFADDIRGLMDYLKIEKAHIIGWSLGGMIVQQFALDHPTRANKIVLINTFYAGMNKSGDKRFKEIYVEMRLKDLEVLKQNPEESFWSSARASYHHQFRKKMKADTKKKFYGLWSVDEIIKERSIDPPTPQDIKNQASALDGFNLYDKLGEIKNETLLIASSHDKVLSKMGMKEMHEKIPNSSLEIIEKAGHSSPRSRAPEVNRILINFLKE